MLTTSTWILSDKRKKQEAPNPKHKIFSDNNNNNDDDDDYIDREDGENRVEGMMKPWVIIDSDDENGDNDGDIGYGGDDSCEGNNDANGHKTYCRDDNDDGNNYYYYNDDGRGHGDDDGWWRIDDCSIDDGADDSYDGNYDNDDNDDITYCRDDDCDDDDNDDVGGGDHSHG